jgi:2-polyprenyl-3-methyl-5-hydroxy-6-metoxy-1,4-benzoquinol methylase
MLEDASEGWDAVAARFIALRSDSGAALVRKWAASHLAPGAAIVDVGCGSGVPIAQALTVDGFALFGIDAAPAMVAAFRARFPAVPVACEAAQHSAFFGRRFDAAVCIGLLFLLGEGDQRAVLHRIAGALVPGGRLLFSAPREVCGWDDLLTGRPSRSLGEAGYAALLAQCGMRLVGGQTDEGGNHYFDAVRVA